MCKMCEVSQKDKFAGGYDFKCLQCCARAIKSARPLGQSHQESIIEYINELKKEINNLGALNEKK
jgi:hypothetical protein